MDLVKPVPDRAMIVELDATGKGDLGAGRDERLGLDAALGGEEIAAVDHSGRQRSMVDHRARARTPRRAGVTLAQFGRDVAEKLHAVAAFDEGKALGQEAFELDRADFGAVLLLLAAL